MFLVTVQPHTCVYSSLSRHKLFPLGSCAREGHLIRSTALELSKLSNHHHSADGEWDKLALKLIGELDISKHPVFKCTNSDRKEEEEEELDRISETSQKIISCS